MHLLPLLAAVALVPFHASTQARSPSKAATQALRLDPKELVGVTTGNTDHPTGELVAIDPATGKSRTLAGIVPAGGQRYASDLVFTADRKALLVSIVEIGDNAARWQLAQVDPAQGKVTRSTPLADGALDALCWAPDGRLLAAWAQSRPQKLVVVDTATGACTERGTLEARLWIRSLAFDEQGALWGLHTPTPELDLDALVRLDPANGATLAVVKLALPTPALSLEFDAGGRALVAADGERLHEVDRASGKSRGSVEVGYFRAVGLERVR